MAELISNLQERLNIALQLNNKKPMDLCNALDIPKSAVSQYLSGKSKKMDVTRLHDIANYLKVDEVWLLGYDVPMKNIFLRDQARFDIDIEALYYDEKAEWDAMVSKDNEVQAMLKQYYSLPEDKKETVRRIIHDYCTGLSNGK